MFRLGGNVRQNYSNGTTFSDIEKLIQERAALREKAIGGIRTALPLQVLANQPIESIRGIGDVVNILSGLPKDPGFLGALTKLPSLDLKMKEGELSDKISLAGVSNVIPSAVRMPFLPLFIPSKVRICLSSFLFIDNKPFL